MRAEEHRELHLALGAYALGDLEPGERAGVEGHLRECPECRAEAAALAAVGRLLPLADPSRFAAPTPAPPAELGERIAARISAEQGARRVRRRRRRGGALALAAAAVVAIVLALVVGGGGDGGGSPAQRVEFGSLPRGVEIAAELEPRAYGTEIHMYVDGIRSGTLCRVFLRDPRGRSFPAGSFRYRWGGGHGAVLSSALDLARTRWVAVQAGARTYQAPVGQEAGEPPNTALEDS